MLRIGGLNRLWAHGPNLCRMHQALLRGGTIAGIAGWASTRRPMGSRGLMASILRELMRFIASPICDAGFDWCPRRTAPIIEQVEAAARRGTGQAPSCRETMGHQWRECDSMIDLRVMPHRWASVIRRSIRGSVARGNRVIQEARLGRSNDPAAHAVRVESPTTSLRWRGKLTESRRDGRRAYRDPGDTLRLCAGYAGDEASWVLFRPRVKQFSPGQVSVPYTPWPMLSSRTACLAQTWMSFELQKPG